jgi:hypothetical protein
VKGDGGRSADGPILCVQQAWARVVPSVAGSTCNVTGWMRAASRHLLGSDIQALASPVINRTSGVKNVESKGGKTSTIFCIVRCTHRYVCVFLYFGRGRKSSRQIMQMKMKNRIESLNALGLGSGPDGLGGCSTDCKGLFG